MNIRVSQNLVVSFLDKWLPSNWSFEDYVFKTDAYQSINEIVGWDE